MHEKTSDGELPTGWHRRPLRGRTAASIAEQVVELAGGSYYPRLYVSVIVDAQGRNVEPVQIMAATMDEYAEEIHYVPLAVERDENGWPYRIDLPAGQIELDRSAISAIERTAADATKAALARWYSPSAVEL